MNIDVTVTAVGTATLVECSVCGPVGVSLVIPSSAAREHLGVHGAADIHEKVHE